MSRIWKGFTEIRSNTNFDFCLDIFYYYYNNVCNCFHIACAQGRGSESTCCLYIRFHVSAPATLVTGSCNAQYWTCQRNNFLCLDRHVVETWPYCTVLLFVLYRLEFWSLVIMLEHRLRDKI
jgi:hypothetical protein